MNQVPAGYKQVGTNRHGSPILEHATQNLHLAFAREAKATKLAATAHTHGLGYKLLELATDEHWARLAVAAGVRMPSAETRVIALGKLRRMQEPVKWPRY